MFNILMVHTKIWKIGLSSSSPLINFCNINIQTSKQYQTISDLVRPNHYFKQQLVLFSFPNRNFESEIQILNVYLLKEFNLPRPHVPSIYD